MNADRVIYVEDMGNGAIVRVRTPVEEWEILAEMRNRLETPEEKAAFDAALAKIVDESFLGGPPGGPEPLGIMQTTP